MLMYACTRHLTCRQSLILKKKKKPAHINSYFFFYFSFWGTKSNPYFYNVENWLIFWCTERKICLCCPSHLFVQMISIFLVLQLSFRWNWIFQRHCVGAPIPITSIIQFHAIASGEANREVHIHPKKKKKEVIIMI